MEGTPKGTSCPRCGREVAPDLDFCASCGEGLAAVPAGGQAPPRGFNLGEQIEQCEIAGQPRVYELGERYPARDTTSGRVVELRVIRPPAGVRPGNLVRFRAFLRAAGSLRAAGLRDLIRSSEEAGCFRLVLDAPAGEPLSRSLVGPSGAPRALERQLARAVLDAVCETLERVHEVSLHGKLWPEAIRVDFNAGGALGGLWLDLPGEIWLQPDPRESAEHTPRTAAYVAPELLEGEPPAVPADQYAVGVLAYELLTGRPPRGLAPPPSQVASRLSPAIDRVVARALAERPNGRYAAIGDLRRDLYEALGEAPRSRIEEELRVPVPGAIAAVPSPSLLEPATSSLPRRRGRFWSALAVLLVLLGLAAGGAALFWERLAGPSRIGSRDPAQLTVRTVPPGTAVNLDGTDLGHAPLTLNEVSPKVTHFLRLTAEGHQLKVVEVKLDPGQRRVLVVRLEPED